MSTPSWVSFPVLERSPGELAQAVAAAFIDQDITLYGLSELEAPTSNGVIECSNNMITCKSEYIALALAHEWYGCVLTYAAQEAKSYLDVYIWPSGDNTAIALGFESQALYFRSDKYREGQWLEELLIALTGSLNADGCLYGDDEMMYIPLDVKKTADSLRKATLIHSHLPLFFMLAQSAIDRDDITRVMSDLTIPGFRLITIGTTYYIISNLARYTLP